MKWMLRRRRNIACGASGTQHCLHIESWKRNSPRGHPERAFRRLEERADAGCCKIELRVVFDWLELGAVAGVGVLSSSRDGVGPSDELMLSYFIFYFFIFEMREQMLILAHPETGAGLYKL
jgi:hypothetical protein